MAKLTVEIDDGMSLAEARAWVRAIADKYGTDVVEEVIKQRIAGMAPPFEPVSQQPGATRCVQCGEFNCDEEGVGHYRG